MAKEQKQEDHVTKYEKARMIGARALQISLGAPFMVKVDEDMLKRIKYNPLEIAKMEFEAGVIPLQVRRTPPKRVDISVEQSLEQLKSETTSLIPDDV